jgi:hypothetical protein
MASGPEKGFHTLARFELSRRKGKRSTSGTARVASNSRLSRHPEA